MKQIKILVVEDDLLKREFIKNFLKERGITNVHYCISVSPALRYAVEEKSSLSGIILDLGLTSFDASDDYNIYKGLDLVKELTRKRIDIPILINSTTTIDLQLLMESHKNLRGQTSYEYDGYKGFDWFISSLEKKQ